VRVRAVGTAFSVRRRDNGADVIVTEGTVEAWVTGAEGDLVRLTAGQRAFVADHAVIVKKTETSAEADRALAWRSGQIDLAGESLGDAIAEFNRYNERKIVLTDQRLSSEPLFGVFQTDDPEGFAQAVHLGFGVPVSASKERIAIGATSN
jgi:transmembrane sensor